MGGFRDQGVETGRAGPEYLIIRLLGWHSIFNFEIRISVFLGGFLTPGIPHDTVLNLSTWLNICNRPFANERRADL